MMTKILFFSLLIAFTACSSAPPKVPISTDTHRLELVMPLQVSEKVEPKYVSSASGLLYFDSKAYVVADDEVELFAFDLNNKSFSYLQSARPSKKQSLQKDPKPDFEALLYIPAKDREYIVAIPSGSKESRVVGARFSLDKAPSPVLDFTALYQHLATQVEMLNIEGSYIVGEYLVLMNRGNNKQPESALFYLDKAQFIKELKLKKFSAKSFIRVEKIPLGEVEGTILGFSDGKYIEGQGLYFLASAESTDTAHANGKVIGTRLALLKNDAKIESLAWFPQEKFEGLEVVQENGKLTFYLANDPDDRSQVARLLKFKLLDK